MVLGSCTWALALLLTATPPSEDPRVKLVQLQLEGQPQAALQEVERLLAAEPERAHQMGLGYLQGHLLEQLGKPSEASQAFVDVISDTPALAAYGRYRLALLQERQQHPEVAAGLVATLLRKDPPPLLVPEAARLLRRTLSMGGDCRLLNGLNMEGFATRERRFLLFSQASCDLRLGQEDRGRQLMLELLAEAGGDETAREVVDLIADKPPAVADGVVALMVGNTLHQHREFQRSVRYLRRALQALNTGSGLAVGDDFETRYSIVRSYFWLGRYAEAAAGFGDLAKLARLPRDQAKVLFQQGRSLELNRDWQRAPNSFRSAYNADPDGPWAGAALFAALRLEWLSDHEESALEIYELLQSKRSEGALAAQASLFLAASELVQGRADRAGSWLSRAQAKSRRSEPEVDYWRGRLAELKDEPAAAVRAYLRLVAEDSAHPLAQLAVIRLRGEALAAEAQAQGRRLAAGKKAEELYQAWLLLGDGDPVGREAWNRLDRLLRSDRSAGPFLTMAPLPVERWPLWQASLSQPEELLLALGRWQEGGALIGRFFPRSEPALALTGSFLLEQSGQVDRSLRLADFLHERLPAHVPEELLPLGYRRLLYPHAFGGLIDQQSRRFGIEANLLRAIIREESRFDPQALSPAAARGLTQFIMPTARRLANQHGLGRLRPTALYEPENAITLGAAYVSELLRDFDGNIPLAVAAYNAGVPQAGLWHSYCYSADPAEFLTKVSFQETRAYLRRVLSSLAQYRDIDARLVGVPPAQLAVARK